MSTITAKANTTIAFTDGACKGNPGVGGWGAYLIFADGRTQDLFGGEDNTTNNRMELMGAIQALQHTPTDQQLEIWTDSSYVKNGITQWIEGWKQKGWKTANKKPVANQDLWQQLDQLTQARPVSWHWVKGHNGHAGNEKADELANQGVISITEPHTNTDTNHGQNVPQSTQNMQSLNTTHQATQSVSITEDWLENDPLGFGLSDVPETPIQQDKIQHDKSSYIEQETQNIADNVEPNAVEFDGDTSRANPYFVPLLPIPKHRHDNDRQLIMDTETTGLDAQKGDRIIEVGIVELVGRRFTGEKLHVYINPQRGLQEDAIRVHGISEAFLADKPTFDKVAKQLYDFMDGAEVIAHNAPFDIGFLSMEFNKVGLTDFSQRIKVTDTLALAKQQYPGQKNTLDALVKRLNVGKQDRTFHGALLDAEILAEVYLAMTGGQVSLAIDEETPTEGGGSHANFAHLSSLLLKASSDPTAHQSWIESLADSYPNLHTVWNT